MRSLFGTPVHITARAPRIQCSPEFARLQTPELVAKTNRWMAEFFGFKELVPNGRVISDQRTGALYMNEATWNQVRKAISK